MAHKSAGIQRRIKLQYAIVDSGLTHRVIGRMTKIHYTTISGICSGRLNPSLDEQARIAKALDRKVEELFA